MALVTMAFAVVPKPPATDITPSRSLPVRVVLMGASESADLTLAWADAALSAQV